MAKGSGKPVSDLARTMLGSLSKNLKDPKGFYKKDYERTRKRSSQKKKSAIVSELEGILSGRKPDEGN